MEKIKNTCKRLFSQNNRTGKKFNQVLIVLNFLFITILIYEVGWGSTPSIQALEVFLGIVFALELGARFWIANNKSTFWNRWLNIIDLIVVLAVFGKYFVFDVILLQMISGLRIFRSYRVLSELAMQNKKIFYYYETIRVILSLLIFVFIMSGVVFSVLGPKNENINSFTDALYFTITTLTTTGFGDITVSDQSDKLLVIFIMVFGAALFLRLATNLFRPRKIFYRCGHCGLTQHEPDSSHCKHCGNVIKNEGLKE